MISEEVEEEKEKRKGEDGGKERKSEEKEKRRRWSGKDGSAMQPASFKLLFFPCNGGHGNTQESIGYKNYTQDFYEKALSINYCIYQFKKFGCRY